LASRFTRARLPVVKVYEELGFDHSGALKREVAIKRLSKLEKVELIKKA
jgi:putative endonuclease